jgi:hypothetical protein
MEYDSPSSPFYRSLMTGLFVGIIDTLVCLVYNLVYRNSTGFQLSDIINVSSLIFFVNLLFPIIGMVYNGFLKWFKKGDLVYVIVFLVLTLFFAWRSEVVHRANDKTINHEFRTLLLGIVLILGVSAALLVPYLYHNKKFEEYVV